MKRSLEGTKRVSSRPKKQVKSYHEDKLSSLDAAAVDPPTGTSAKNPPKITIHPDKQPIPTKSKKGYYQFGDHPEFRPNLSPKEVLQLGSFGGTYFRVITSGVTGLTYREAWKELPPDWLEGLKIPRQVSSQTYDVSVNRYGVSCGGDLHMWESSGWITEADPFGWFQWYCRFFQGRRCSDDGRQISRGNGVMGPKGRWRNNLVNRCLKSGKSPEDALHDPKISPKVRQLLQHWGYQLTMEDLEAGMKKITEK